MNCNGLASYEYNSRKMGTARKQKMGMIREPDEGINFNMQIALFLHDASW